MLFCGVSFHRVVLAVFSLWVCGGETFQLTILPPLQGQAPDWQDFLGILALLLINSTISFVEENNAGNAAAALMAQLAPKTKVRVSRFSTFVEVPTMASTLPLWVISSCYLYF